MPVIFLVAGLCLFIFMSHIGIAEAARNGRKEVDGGTYFSFAIMHFFGCFGLIVTWECGKVLWEAYKVLQASQGY